MTRTDIINYFIDKNNFKSYLEIGVNTPSQPGYNWVGVNIETKHGVDPNVDTTYKMPSDKFFEEVISRKYDIIFVDGLHLWEQVYRDIKNSLEYLEDGGVIVVHDCNPVEEITQRRVRASDAWHGDVWKAIVQMRMEEPFLNIHTVDTDEGCSIIQKGSQELLNISSNEDPYSFESLDRRRREYLNLITPEEFLEIYK